MYTILITGINGFLGSHIAKRLCANHRILGLVRNTENLFRLGSYSFDVYKSDEETIKQVFINHKVDIIIHTATSYGRHNPAGIELAESNLLFPLRLLDIAINNEVKTFINSDTVLDRYVNFYSLTKRQFHDWLYFRSNQIKAINFQLEHFYGPGCDNSNFITGMFEKLKNNEKYIDLTGGEQNRDFIYFEDIVDAYELIINKLNDLPNQYSNFQLGSGELITIKALVSQMKEMAHSSTVLNFGAIPYRENELMESITDNSALLELGWKSKTSLKEGLKKTI